MLILTRKPGQLFTIAPDTLLDPTTPVSVLFHSPIEILVTQVSGIQVKIGVQAHPCSRSCVMSCTASEKNKI